MSDSKIIKRSVNVPLNKKFIITQLFDSKIVQSKIMENPEYKQSIQTIDQFKKQKLTNPSLFTSNTTFHQKKCQRCKKWQEYVNEYQTTMLLLQRKLIQRQSQLNQAFLKLLKANQINKQLDSKQKKNKMEIYNQFDYNLTKIQKQNQSINKILSNQIQKSSQLTSKLTFIKKQTINTRQQDNKNILKQKHQIKQLKDKVSKFIFENNNLKSYNQTLLARLQQCNKKKY